MIFITIKKKKEALGVQLLLFSSQSRSLGRGYRWWRAKSVSPSSFISQHASIQSKCPLSTTLVFLRDDWHPLIPTSVSASPSGWNTFPPLLVWLIPTIFHPGPSGCSYGVSTTKRYLRHSTTVLYCIVLYCSFLFPSVPSTDS